MDHFITDHHNQLMDLFDSQLYPLEIIEAATQLLEICLIEQPDESVKAVAGSQYLKQFSSMLNGKGLPKKEDVETFVGRQPKHVSWV